MTIIDELLIVEELVGAKPLYRLNSINILLAEYFGYVCNR